MGIGSRFVCAAILACHLHAVMFDVNTIIGAVCDGIAGSGSVGDQVRSAAFKERNARGGRAHQAAFGRSRTGQGSADATVNNPAAPVTSTSQFSDTGGVGNSMPDSDPTPSQKEIWALAVSVFFMIVAEILMIQRIKRKKRAVNPSENSSDLCGGVGRGVISTRESQSQQI